VGLLLGAGGVLAMRLMQCGHRPSLALGMCLAVTTLSIGQHYLSYRWARTRAILAQEKLAQKVTGVKDIAQLGPPVPESLSDYLMTEAEQGRRLFGYLARGPLVWA